MKCVVGIDLERHYSSALALLGRLQLCISETTLLHITEPLQLALPYSAYGMMVETDEIHETLMHAGQMVLNDALVDASGLNLNPSVQLCDGFPTATLIDFADQNHTDLIALTSTVRSALGAVFGGSVARGLAISAHQSVLIAREDIPVDGPIRAVFASDQSPYSAQCMKLLSQFEPKGISHMTLLTILDRNKHEGILSLLHHTDIANVMDDAEKRMREKGIACAQWLTENGIPTSSRVESGHVEETIHKVMDESKADLLIVGSQGHGFIDRMMVGSTSLHEVISENYPVLLLRP